MVWRIFSLIESFYGRSYSLKHFHKCKFYHQRTQQNGHYKENPSNHKLLTVRGVDFCASQKMFGGLILPYWSVRKLKNYLQKTTDHLPGHRWPAEEAVWWRGSAVQQLGAPLHRQPVHHAEQGVQAVKYRYRVFVMAAATMSSCWWRWWGTASRCRTCTARCYLVPRPPAQPALHYC